MFLKKIEGDVTAKLNNTIVDYLEWTELLFSCGLEHAPVHLSSVRTGDPGSRGFMRAPSPLPTVTMAPRPYTGWLRGRCPHRPRIKRLGAVRRTDLGLFVCRTR